MALLLLRRVFIAAVVFDVMTVTSSSSTFNCII